MHSDWQSLCFQQSDKDTPPNENAAGTPIALNALTIVPIVRLWPFSILDTYARLTPMSSPSCS